MTKKKQMTPRQDAKAFKMSEDGLSFREIGRKLGRDGKTIKQAVQRHKLHGDPVWESDLVWRADHIYQKCSKMDVEPDVQMRLAIDMAWMAHIEWGLPFIQLIAELEKKWR